MTMALASFRDLAGAIVPGGDPAAPTRGGRRRGADARRAVRPRLGRPADGSRPRLPSMRLPRGGCQFLGTAATAQVVAEALGLRVPSALAPSGQNVWLDVARRTAGAVHAQWRDGRTLGDVVTDEAIENAMLVHAASAA